MINAALSLGMGPLPEKPPIPEDNPMTPAKVALGKQLFFEPRLSKNSKISCNSCHNLTDAATGTDNQPFSTGFNGKKGGRNSPTVWNAAFNLVQFWDGRAATLEEQAKGPLINPVEMGMENHGEVMKRVSAIPSYAEQFTEVFGKENPLTISNLAKAIAAYERTLLTPNAPLDRFFRGDRKALSVPAQRGMRLVSQLGCLGCHNGPLFHGLYMSFPLISGTEYDKKYGFSKDLGRFEVTRNPEDKNKWRVPSWRNVELTAPYFHNGSVDTLDEAVRVMAKTQLGRDLKHSQVGDIVAFLKSLTGERPKQVEPELPN